MVGPSVSFHPKGDDLSKFLIVKIPHTILFICLNDNHILGPLLTSWNICNSKRSSRNGRILLGRVSKNASFWKLIFSLGWNLKASRYPPKTRKICQLLKEKNYNYNPTNKNYSKSTFKQN